MTNELTNTIFEEKEMEEECHIDTLQPLSIKNETYKVYSFKEEDNLTYKTILFKGVFDGYDLKVEPKTDRCIIQEEIPGNDEPLILAGFKFKLDDGLFFEYEKPKTVAGYLDDLNKEPDLAEIVKRALSTYFLRNRDLLNKTQDDGAEESDNIFVLPVEERKKPTFDKEVAGRFSKKLEEEYDNNIILFLQDELPNMMISEQENIIKIWIACMAVIFGIESYIIELLGLAGFGKTFIIKFIEEYLIPAGYFLDVENITESAFKLFSRDCPDFFDGLIVNFGDLGRPEALDRLGGVFDVVKILVTDNKYRDVVNEKGADGNWGHHRVIDIITQSCGAIYATVEGDNSKFSKVTDVKDQKSSRTLSFCPLAKDTLEMAKFNNEKVVPGSKTNKKYIKSQKVFADFLEWLKMKIYYFDLEESERILIPFSDLFYKTTEFSPVQIRKMNQLTKLLKTLTYLNKERAIELKDKNDTTYWVPRFEDVEMFIDLTYNNSSLKEVDRNLLLKLKREIADVHTVPNTAENRTAINDGTLEHSLTGLSSSVYEIDNNNITITSVRDDKGIDECIVQSELKANGHNHEEEVSKSSDKEQYLENPRVMSTLLDSYGITAPNRRHNKEILNNSQQSLDNAELKPQVFFTAPAINRIFSNDEAVSFVPNLAKTFDDLYKKGFLRKLESTTGRNQNVFTVTPKILEVKDRFEISEDDKLVACANVLGMEILTIDELKPMCQNYGVGTDDLKK